MTYFVSKNANISLPRNIVLSCVPAIADFSGPTLAFLDSRSAKGEGAVGNGLGDQSAKPEGRGAKCSKLICALLRVIHLSKDTAAFYSAHDTFLTIHVPKVRWDIGAREFSSHTSYFRKQMPKSERQGL